MRTIMLASIITVLLSWGLFTASGQAPVRRDGVLAVLRAGQPVSLKETNGRYEIGVFERGPGVLGHKMIEVGEDFVVVEDVAGITESRIPLYSIKAVVILRVGK